MKKVISLSRKTCMHTGFNFSCQRWIPVQYGVVKDGPRFDFGCQKWTSVHTPLPIVVQVRFRFAGKIGPMQVSLLATGPQAAAGNSNCPDSGPQGNSNSPEGRYQHVPPWDTYRYVNVIAIWDSLFQLDPKNGGTEPRDNHMS